MASYSCVIVDGESKAAEILLQEIQSLYSDIVIEASFIDATKAIQYLRNNKVDILFLDISMPQLDGFTFFQMVPHLEAQTIIITAHSEYAIEAFEFNLCGYILKPIKQASLSRAVDRARANLQVKRKTVFNTIHYGKISIPNNSSIYYVDSNAIIYFEGRERYTNIYLSNGEKLCSSYSLGTFKNIVKENTFVQIHRSYIINLTNVRMYERKGILIMNNNVEIPVSKSERAKLLQLFS